MDLIHIPKLQKKNKRNDKFINTIRCFVVICLVAWIVSLLLFSRSVATVVRHSIKLPLHMFLLANDL